MPWEKDKHGGVSQLPHKANGDCIYLEEHGCSLFGKPERPYTCRQFDCRNKVKEWMARGKPSLSKDIAPVIWAGIKRQRNDEKQ